MAKFMSILEKYNLVEKASKENSEIPSVEVLASDVEINSASIVQKQVTDTEDGLIPENNTNSSRLSDIDVYIDKDKKISIAEIYNQNSLDNSDINTVFMLQNLINALPQNLPQDIIKQSVLGVINASKIDLNHLLLDGEKRLEVLNKVMGTYHNQTVKKISEYKEEIARLSKLINSYNDKIKVKESLLEDQKYLVDYEVQKVTNIIDFFQK